MNQNKICNRCKQGMRPKFGGIAFKCKCGNVYIDGKGYQMLQPGEDIYIQKCQVHGKTLFYPEIGVEDVEKSETPEKLTVFVPPETASEGGAYQRKASQIVKGGMYFVKLPSQGVGRVIMRDRPCIVVGNVQQMDYTSTVTVIPCTTSRRQDNLKSHVKIASGGRYAIAKVEQITTVDTHRIGDFMGMASVSEMIELKRTMQQYLSYTEKVPEEQVANANLLADNYALMKQLNETAEEVQNLRRQLGMEQG